MDFVNYINKTNIPEKEYDSINETLFNIFNNTQLKNYISNKYPEIYPEHIGLKLDIDGKYKWGLWWYQHNYDDINERGWNFYLTSKIEKCINDIKEFYKNHNKEFYNFLMTI